MDKELQIPLLELALAKQEVPRGDLVAERLPDLADPKRDLHTRRLDHVVKVEVNVLAGLTAQVSLHTLALDNAQVRLHQKIKSARLHQLATTIRALVLYHIFFWQMINAETPL